MLVEFGLVHLLGICTLDDTNEGICTEFTSGVANITLPVDLDTMGNSIDAVWRFNNTAAGPDSIAFGPSHTPTYLLLFLEIIVSI